MAFYNRRSGKGDELTPAEEVWVQTGAAGVVNLAETTAPSPTANTGKLYVKSTDSRLYFKDDSGTEFDLLAGGGATTFLGLTDTPSSYTGAGGKVVAVNAGETGLEFITPTAGANTSLSNLSAVAINASLIPGTSNTIDLGSATIGWRDVYSQTLKLSGSTSGTITLQAAAVAGLNTITLPASTGTVALTSNKLSDFASTTSAELAGVISDKTGSGALVFANSPTLISPNLGTPASGNLENCTGLPISTGVSGLGAGVATFLSTPSSANLAAAVTDKTGSGALVFANSPTLVTPVLGDASATSLTLTNALAIASGGTGASDAATARTNLGLGSIATQDANAVAITGGSITGITDLAIADGGTGASDAATARTNLGLGSMATQDANAVAITGGSITGITPLAVADGGTGASTAAAAFDNLKQAATDAYAGVVELATIAETTAGTDATRAVTPDGLAGSIFGTKAFSVQVIDGATPLSVGDGKAYFRVPASMNGMNITGVAAQVITASTSGTPTIQIARGRQSSPTSNFTYVDVLSTPITIDVNEYDSKDATTAAVINPANDDLATGDVLRIDVDAAGTGTKGLNITIECMLP